MLPSFLRKLSAPILFSTRVSEYNNAGFPPRICGPRVIGRLLFDGNRRKRRASVSIGLNVRRGIYSSSATKRKTDGGLNVICFAVETNPAKGLLSNEGDRRIVRSNFPHRKKQTVRSHRFRRGVLSGDHHNFTVESCRNGTRAQQPSRPLTGTRIMQKSFFL